MAGLQKKSKGKEEFYWQSHCGHGAPAAPHAQREHASQRQQHRHVAGARNLDVSAPQFGSSIKTLDARRTYLVYCQSGSRSARAAGAMRAAGLTVLDGGGLRSMQANGWTVGP